LIRKGDISLVRALLAGGADPNGADLRRDTPLLVALAQGDREMARLLVDNGASLSGALGLAVEKDDIPLASFMLTLGADPDDHWRGGPALHSCNSVPMARLLIDAGCDLDARDVNGWSAIHHICRATPTDAVKELLLFLCACGSAVDVKTPHGRPQDFCFDRDSFFLLGACWCESRPLVGPPPSV
jgi:ankyrin repeat protein